MRKLFTGFLLFGCLMTQARQISPGEAKAYASDFLNSQELQTATKALTPMKAPGVSADAQASPYYVFNRGEADGFVIISGDDRAPKILGYSDRGSFDATNLPPQLKVMMEQWATRMGQLPVGASQHPSWSKAPATRAGEVLLETAEWGQGAPYNNLCPTVGSDKAPAGCVATAMAIAMKYHNWPDATRGGEEYDFYMPSETFDFDSYSIDWDALSDKENPKFAEEAAKLTYSAGVAAQMSYGPNESSAVSWILGHLLRYFYAYDKDCQVLPREKFDDAQWNSMLREQLENVGPVIYFGNGAGGDLAVYAADGDENPVGHCFVVDGYDAEGLYHVNWGWDGVSNGYFDLDFSVDGMKFNNYQGMVINIKPDKEKNVYSRAWMPNCEAYIGGEVNDWNFLKPDIVEGETNKIKTPTLCISQFQGYVGLAVVDNNDNIIKLIDESYVLLDGQRVYCSMPGSSFFGFESLVLPKLNEGERYQLVSQEVPNIFDEGSDPKELLSTDIKDWHILLGGMIHPSYFYATGNHSKISEVRVHIPENLPSYCSSRNSLDKEFVLQDLMGWARPVSFYFPTKNVKYQLTALNEEGEAVEPVYVTWDIEDYPNFIGFNISLYAKEYDLSFSYEGDEDTRRDSGIPSEQVVENDGLVYKKLTGGLELIGYDKIGETVIIPDSILVEGSKLPVISLADMALAFAPVKHVEIQPDSLLIGQFVLAGTSQLEDVSIKDLSLSLGDTPNPHNRLMFVQSGLKTVYFDSVPREDKMFYVLSGHEYAFNFEENVWSSSNTGTDVDFVVSAAPSDGNDEVYFWGVDMFLRGTPADNKNSAFKSYIIPGLGNTAVSAKKNDIPFNIREMWKYDIDKKNNQVRLDSIMSNVEIENVLINGAQAEIGSNGFYSVASDSLTRSGDAKDLDVVINYLVNGVKRSTNYSPAFNRSLTSTEASVLVDSIVFTPESWSGIEGESFTITATVLPENATDKTLVWASSDETIASVDSVGNVKALRIGEAVITAKAADGSDISASCAVKVNPVLVDSIAFTPESWTGVEGESFTITATVLPENATDKSLVWASSDESIASVDSVGNVKALRIGDAVITAKAADGSDISASCAVKVNPVLVDSIAFTPESWSGVEGESFTITAAVLPENATDKTLVWASSDETIASVDSVGNVKALRIGEAVITAKAADGSDISASCAVKVNPVHVDSIAFTPESWSGVEGESFTITATVLPENATDKTLVWASSDETIASVDSVGNVKALRVGDAVITAKAADGSDISASCAVKVNPVLVDSIAFTPESWSGVEGESFTITAAVLPENATDKTLVWASSDETIASVDSVGNVKALRIGEAVITAKAADGSDISASCVVKVNPVLVDSIAISRSEATLNAGETLSLTVTVLPENATDKTVTWTSSNEAVATVDANGTVTALAVGTATITASCGEVSAICVVTVEPILVESIQLTPDNWSGVEGESFSIVAIVLPEDATDASIEWSSSDETVATVDDKGNVAILKSGTCVITAAAVDGSGVYAECIITGTSGIDGIFSGSDSFDIYDLGGIQIKKNANRETLKTLTPGIYILRNGSEMKKLVIR